MLHRGSGIFFSFLFFFFPPEELPKQSDIDEDGSLLLAEAGYGAATSSLFPSPSSALDKKLQYFLCFQLSVCSAPLIYAQIELK